MFSREDLKIIANLIEYCIEQYETSGGEIDPACLGNKSITKYTKIYNKIMKELNNETF